MADLTIQSIVEGGLNPSFAAASSGGDSIKNPGDERTFFFVKNGGGSQVTVTATAQDTSIKLKGFGALSRADMVVSVPAGQDRLIGPFPAAFNDGSGKVAVTYSAVTSVTVAAIRLPRSS